MELTDKMWREMSEPSRTCYTYASRGSVAKVLASIPEQGTPSVTLDEAKQICSALMPPPSYHNTRRTINAILALRDAKCSRPAPAPEPAPQQEAAVVEEMRRTYLDAPPDGQPWYAILDIARRGRVPLEDVRLAIIGYFQTGSKNPVELEAIADSIIVRLTTALKPTKQERVRVFQVSSSVGAAGRDWCVIVDENSGNPKTCYGLRKDVALAYREKVQKELEAQNGK